MARTRFRNPVGFLPTPVTFIVVATYVAIAAALLYVHHVVPPAPKKDSPIAGINVTEAWRDLQTLSSGYHPYNSRKNDEVHNWLLNRIDEILSENDARRPAHDGSSELAPVVVYNDMVSNTTLRSVRRPTSVYFEGTNIIVYIRGSDDGDSDWWQDATSAKKARHNRGLLVNAHYDSVSTGFGATDDGVGVVTILQLIKYYSKEGHQPKRGLVALLNNGEEDFLNGAYAFTRHPISKLPDTFLNLEGAGAGGRATLFRSTDAEVTKYYGKSPHPFGTVISADAFKRRVVRSETDYVVFKEQLGLRGLDVAFFEPRARYHTSEDSARETSKASIWHMLSAALATTKALTSDTNTKFKPGEGSGAVYFDVFGVGFGLMNLHDLFALSITLLVIAPLALIAIIFILGKNDKLYLFASKRKSDPLDPHSPDDAAIIHFGGWKGFSRYPIAFVSASAAVVGLAFLIAKVNPLIIYSSHYSVWSMMLSAWFIVAWFFLRGADVMRPSALHRTHALGWIFLLTWLLLLAASIGENNLKLGGGYFMSIYFAGAFAALAISYLEFLGLRRRRHYAEISSHSDDQNRPASNPQQNPGSSQLPSDEDDGPESSDRLRNDDDGLEPTESTSLLGKSARSTFNRYARQRNTDESIDEDSHVPSFVRSRVFGEEQAWSSHLPSWLWAVEFFVFAPFALIFVGPVALLTTESLHQTIADGNSALTVYFLVAILSILLLMPASPFIHRIASRLPTLLFLVFAATLIYNLLAFPFSSQNRLKVFFRQDVDLETGINHVSLSGLNGYVQKIVTEIPSAAGQPIKCGENKGFPEGLTTCTWYGLAPNVVPTSVAPWDHPITPPEKEYPKWLSVVATRTNTSDADRRLGEAKIKISGANTRACRLLFDSPIVNFYVTGAEEGKDGYKNGVLEVETKEIRLWSRTWNRHWTVHVQWNATEDAQDDDMNGASNIKAEMDSIGKGLDGTASCLWSDANERGVIPAFDEVSRYMPVWSIVTKLDDGLVFGSKKFLV